MRYELDTIYQAFVDLDGVFARLYFIVDYDYHRVSAKDAYDVDWHMFPVNPACPQVLYKSPSGVWKLGAEGAWTLKRGEFLYRAVISKADDRDPQVKDDLHGGPMKGKHYDAITEDDMVDAFAYGITRKEDVEEEVKQAIDWHKMMKEGEKRMKEGLDKRMFELPLVVAKRMRTGIITNITEGGNEMHKELYHVILFNRKTEKIDYKAYITATDETKAAMTAAHDYDEYDGKIHKLIVKMIEGSEYEVIK